MFTEEDLISWKVIIWAFRCGNNPYKYMEVKEHDVLRNFKQIYMIEA